jgi:hypothetical protein
VSAVDAIAYENIDFLKQITVNTNNFLNFKPKFYDVFMQFFDL